MVKIVNKVFNDKYNDSNFESIKHLDDFGNEQRYDQSIKGALISNGKVHYEVVNAIKKYIIEE